MQTSSKPQQIPLSICQNLSRLPRFIHRRRPMCTICWRHWQSSDWTAALSQKPKSRQFCIQKAAFKELHPKNCIECIQKAALQLTMAKCHFGVQQVNSLSLCQSITQHGVAPQNLKLTKFIEEIKIPSSKKALQHYILWPNYNRSYTTRLAD